MLSRIKRIISWWQQRHVRKKQAILHLPDRTIQERCSDLLTYLTENEFAMSRQALGFYQTRLRSRDRGDFVFAVGRLNLQLNKNGGLVREEINQLANLYGDSEISMAQFFGVDDFDKAFSTFVTVTHELVKGLVKLQGKDNIEAIHTLRIIAPFLEALKETLETLVRITQ